MDKAEWAAWVQAIFSVVAIAASAWIASAQGRRDEARRRKQQADIIRSKARLGRFAYVAVKAVRDAHQVGIGQSGAAAVAHNVEHFKSIARSLASLPLTDCGDPVELEALTKTQQVIKELDFFMANYGLQWPQDRIASADRHLNELSSALQELESVAAQVER